jgi:ADP-ribose pyrophosphatase YjhB (NUDIX family)
MVLRIPPGDERPRACCDQCGRVEYSNPKIVVATVVRVSNDHKILLAQRAIEPRKGTWGIPQGYMEHGETSRQAAVREVWEETGVTLRDPSSLALRAVYNVPGSVQLVYEAIVTREEDVAKLQQEIQAYNQRPNGGGESQEVALLSEQQVAEKEICFPTVEWALKHCRSLHFIPATAPDKLTTSTIMPKRVVQQMTKMYNPDSQLWSQYEDEAINI